MPQETHTIQIFVGSPGDVAEERERAFGIIERLNGDPFLRGWRVEPVSWDRTSYANTTWLSPQKAIDDRLPRPSACDIALFVLWSRIGTPLSDADYPPETRPEGLDRAPSGTEWEFFDAMGAGEQTGQPVVLTFRCTRRQVIDTDDEAEEDRLIWQRREVRGFFARFRDEKGSHRWSYTDYADTDDFADKLDSQLRDAINTLIEAIGVA